jgi:hypothetical protein
MAEVRCSCYRPVTRKGRVPCPHNPTSLVVDTRDPARWLLWILLGGMFVAAWKVWG